MPKRLKTLCSVLYPGCALPAVILVLVYVVAPGPVRGDFCTLPLLRSEGAAYRKRYGVPLLIPWRRNYKGLEGSNVFKRLAVNSDLPIMLTSERYQLKRLTDRARNLRRPAQCISEQFGQICKGQISCLVHFHHSTSHRQPTSILREAESSNWRLKRADT